MSVSTNRGEKGRNRYHGQGKRGAPSLEGKYAIDVRLARSELEGALAMLVDGPGIADTRARRENRRAAIAKIALAARALDLVLEREDLALPDTLNPIRPTATR